MGAFFPAEAGYRRLGGEAGPTERTAGSAMLVLHTRLAEVREALAALAASGVGAEDRAQAKRSLEAEAAALATALLHQHPRGRRDALLLVHHLNEALAGTGQEAAAVAAESLFDFLAANVDEDHEPLGEAFQEATVRAFRRNRHRLGLLEP